MAKTQKVRTKVSGLSVSKKWNTVSASWKVPSSMGKSTKKSHAITGITARLSVSTGSGWVSLGDKNIGKSRTSFSSYYDTGGTANPRNRFDRSRYYPVGSKKVTGIKASVRGFNGSHAGPWVEKVWYPQLPAAPSMEQPELDTDTGNVTFKLKMDDVSESTAERYRVRYTSTVTRGTEGGSQTTQRFEGTAPDSGAGSEESTITVTGTDWQTLNQDEWAKVTVEAWAQGLKGDSKKVSRSKLIGWAARPVIKDVTEEEPNESNHRNGKVKVLLEPLDTTYHPATTLQLQYVNTETANADNVNEEEWKDVEGAKADANEVGLVCRWDQVSTTASDTHTFVRVKCTADYAQLYRTSEPVELRKMFTKGQETSVEQPSLISVREVSGSDSSPKAVNVRVAWNDKKYNATEISWSNDQEAWRTNKEPDSFQMPDSTWDEGPNWEPTTDATPDPSKTYARLEDGSYVVVEDPQDVTGLHEQTHPSSTHIKLTGLEENTRYYVKCRRYLTSDEDQRTGWSAIASGMTGASSIGVSSVIPNVVAQGEPLTVSWVVGGSNPQESWTVSVNGRMAASGNDSTTSTTIPAEWLACESNEVTVTSTVLSRHYESRGIVVVKQRPTVSFDATTSRVIDAKPYAFGVAGSPGATVTARLTSCGATSMRPDGSEEQQDGELAWSAAGVIGESGTLAFSVSDAALVDGAEYRLTATPEFTADGLTGATASPRFPVPRTDEVDAHETDRLTVAWSHQAVAPGEATTIATDQEEMTATITPAMPTGYAGGDGFAESDVFDLYRSTEDGCCLVAEGLPFGSSVTDRWAPFAHDGSGSYVICTRTVDGDRDWSEYEYTLVGESVRFDWLGGSLEVPYNLELDDAFEKDFEERRYLDGTSGGWWNEGRGRTMSVSSDMLKSDGQAALRELASHAAPVFVRTPNGLAFEANVDVSGISMTHESKLVGTSFKATEIACATFVCGPGDVGGAE